MTDPAAAVCMPHRLVITRDTWEAALRPLLANGGGFAVGPARWLVTERDRRLLVDEVEVLPEPPTGERFPPLADWFALCVRNGGEREPARAILDRLRPRASQTVVAVAIDAGGRWDGAVFLGEGRVVPLAGLQVVGPGMLEVQREVLADESETDVNLRYSRLEGAVGPSVARRLRAASVTVIGAGRNGSAMAFQLASLGVRQLRLVDGDTLNLENLDAMPGMAVADVGKSKVAALAERLLLLRPDLSVSCFAAPVNERHVTAALRRLPADLIVTAVDSDTARLAASLLARDTLTVHLDLGTSVAREPSGDLLLTGDVRLLLPGAGCVACVGGLADREATLYELFAPEGALRRGRPTAWHQQRAGSLISLNAIAVGTAVQAWLDLLSRRLGASCWHRLRWVPAEGIQADSALVTADENCPFCRREGR